MRGTAHGSTSQVWASEVGPLSSGGCFEHLNTRALAAYFEILAVANEGTESSELLLAPWPTRGFRGGCYRPRPWGVVV
jgi:hypothetical protein